MMSRKLLVSMLLIGAMGSVSACKSKVNDVAPAKVEAAADDTQKEPEKEETKEPENAQTKELAVDTTMSNIFFVGAKITGDHTGGFSKWGGTANVSADNVLEGLEISIDMSSVYTDDDDVNLETYKQNDPNSPPIVQGRLDKHLMNEDFFDVKQFPESTFVSTKIEPVEGQEKVTHNVSGNFTLHGQTKLITFPAEIKVENGKMIAFADFSINRFDYGIKYEGKKDNLIKKEVRLIITLYFSLTP